MLAMMAPKFVTSRVIHFSHFAEAMSIELLKQPFGSHLDYFMTIDSKHFYEVKFYGYISTRGKPSYFMNEYERKAYEEACEKFLLFNEMHDLVERLSNFSREVRVLYNHIERRTSSSNFFSHLQETDKGFEDDVIEALDRYNKMVKNLENYPEWKDKVVEEIGKWFHLIHNNLSESDAKRIIFEKMDRHAFFV